MRKKINLRNGWKFSLENTYSTAYYQGFDDIKWENVTIPHDWSVHYPFSKEYSSGSGYLKGGNAWYRCHFKITDDIENKNVLLTFGGVYKNSKVWINSNYLGKRPYGYSSFNYDITDFIKKGDNVICVNCEHNDMADSRWFTGNGIYREVYLTIREENYIEDCFISTIASNSLQATMKIDTLVKKNENKDYKISYEVYYGNDKIKTEYNDLECKFISNELIIDKPKLWDTDCPNMYILKVILKQNNKIMDELNVNFGIRTFSFDANKGFELNGKNMKLKGLCMHHDAGVLGSAVTKEVWRERFNKFKECGCNAIRCSHNPPDTHFLDLCDEMGFLVIDEAFDEWRDCKNKWWQGHNVYPPKHYGYYEDFDAWHEKDLTDMIIRDRNHPSIILWSIGNEIDYPNDPYVHPLFNEVMGNNDKDKPSNERKYDPNKPDAQRIAKISKELVEIVKSVDKTRPVTAAVAFPELSNLTGYTQTLDIVGYNYKEHLYEQDHEKYPSHILMGSENSTDAKAWLYVKNNDYICSQFLWTGVDFLGECKGWPIRISQAGLMTLSLDEKPLYYQRKMLWNDCPDVKLFTSKYGSNALLRNWNYDEGEKVKVTVYSNCDSVALYVNNELVEERTLCEQDLCCANFEVTYKIGTILKVIGIHHNNTYCDEIVAHGDFEQFVVNDLSKKTDEILQYQIMTADKDSNIIEDKDVEIDVKVENCEFLGIENGKPDDLTPYTATKRTTNKGKVMLYIRNNDNNDKKITISSNKIIKIIC